jgi:hypothetical protein
METYAAGSLVAVVSTGLLLIVRYAFVYALCCKATKENRSIKISSATPLSIKIDFPRSDAPETPKKQPVRLQAVVPAHESEPASLAHNFVRRKDR